MMHDIRGALQYLLLAVACLAGVQASRSSNNSSRGGADHATLVDVRALVNQLTQAGVNSSSLPSVPPISRPPPRADQRHAPVAGTGAVAGAPSTSSIISQTRPARPNPLAVQSAHPAVPAPPIIMPGDRRPLPSIPPPSPSIANGRVLGEGDLEEEEAEDEEEAATNEPSTASTSQSPKTSPSNGRPASATKQKAKEGPRPFRSSGGPNYGHGDSSSSSSVGDKRQESPRVMPSHVHISIRRRDKSKVSEKKVATGKGAKRGDSSSGNSASPQSSSSHSASNSNSSRTASDDSSSSFNTELQCRGGDYFVPDERGKRRRPANYRHTQPAQSSVASPPIGSWERQFDAGLRAPAVHPPPMWRLTDQVDLTALAPMAAQFRSQASALTLRMTLRNQQSLQATSGGLFPPCRRLDPATGLPPASQVHKQSQWMLPDGRHLPVGWYECDVAWWQTSPPSGPPTNAPTNIAVAGLSSASTTSNINNGNSSNGSNASINGRGSKCLGVATFHRHLSHVTVEGPRVPVPIVLRVPSQEVNNSKGRSSTGSDNEGERAGGVVDITLRNHLPEGMRTVHLLLLRYDDPRNPLLIDTTDARETVDNYEQRKGPRHDAGATRGLPVLRHFGSFTVHGLQALQELTVQMPLRPLLFDTTGDRQYTFRRRDLFYVWAYAVAYEHVDKTVNDVEAKRARSRGVRRDTHATFYTLGMSAPFYIYEALEPLTVVTPASLAPLLGGGSGSGGTAVAPLTYPHANTVLGLWGDNTYAFALAPSLVDYRPSSLASTASSTSLASTAVGSAAASEPTVPRHQVGIVQVSRTTMQPSGRSSSSSSPSPSQPSQATQTVAVKASAPACAFDNDLSQGTALLGFGTGTSTTPPVPGGTGTESRTLEDGPVDFIVGHRPIRHVPASGNPGTAIDLTVSQSRRHLMAAMLPSSRSLPSASTSTSTSTSTSANTQAPLPMEVPGAWTKSQTKTNLVTNAVHLPMGGMTLPIGLDFDVIVGLGPWYSQRACRLGDLRLEVSIPDAIVVTPDVATDRHQCILATSSVLTPPSTGNNAYLEFGVGARYIGVRTKVLPMTIPREAIGKPVVILRIVGSVSVYDGGLRRWTSPRPSIILAQSEPVIFSNTILPHQHPPSGHDSASPSSSSSGIQDDALDDGFRMRPFLVPYVTTTLSDRQRMRRRRQLIVSKRASIAANISNNPSATQSPKSRSSSIASKPSPTLSKTSTTLSKKPLSKKPSSSRKPVRVSLKEDFVRVQVRYARPAYIYNPSVQSAVEFKRRVASARSSASVATGGAREPLLHLATLRPWWPVRLDALPMHYRQLNPINFPTASSSSIGSSSNIAGNARNNATMAAAISGLPTNSNVNALDVGVQAVVLTPQQAQLVYRHFQAVHVRPPAQRQVDEHSANANDSDDEEERAEEGTEESIEDEGAEYHHQRRLRRERRFREQQGEQ